MELSTSLFTLSSVSMPLGYDSTYLLEDMNYGVLNLDGASASSTATTAAPSGESLDLFTWNSFPSFFAEGGSSDDVSSEESSVLVFSGAASPMSPSTSEDESITVSDLSASPNPKKRSRDIFEPLPSEIPAAKHAKHWEESSAQRVQVSEVAEVAFESLATATPAGASSSSTMDQLITHQYSLNQLQIQQVMSYLNPAQIQQAMTMSLAPSPTVASAVSPVTVVPSSLGLSVPTQHQIPQPAAPVPLSPPAQAPMPVAPVASTPAPTPAPLNHHHHSHHHHHSTPVTKSKSSSSSGSSSTTRKRPKLDPKKDALQCLGHNRKKNKQCGNAALMEFIGPRPQYCAEHIDLDPNSLYTKCASTHHKLTGDGKGCREVVLKEFGVCHKHFDQVTRTWPLTPAGLATARSTLARVTEILEQLETEAALAKKVDQDLFQRKHKIIPKFVHLARHIESWILNARAQGVTAVSGPSTPTSTPGSTSTSTTTSAVSSPSDLPLL